MIIIARPFPYYNHICSYHFSPKKDLYYELIEDTLKDTEVEDVISEGMSVKVSRTICNECNNKYYIVKGMNLLMIMNEDNTIIRGYIEETV